MAVGGIDVSQEADLTRLCVGALKDFRAAEIRLKQAFAALAQTLTNPGGIADEYMKVKLGTPDVPNAQSFYNEYNSVNVQRVNAEGSLTAAVVQLCAKVGV